MGRLEDKIKEVASKLSKYQREEANMEDTKNGLVRPILQEIGWDFEDIDAVQHRFPLSTKGDVDYALKMEGEPRLLVEVKPIGVYLSAAVTTVGTEKALEAGVPWLVATNGAEIRVLRIDQKIAEDQRTVFHIKLSRCLDDEVRLKEAARLLGYLSPEKVGAGALESSVMKKLKETRIASVVRGYFQSEAFLVAIQDMYKEQYQGEEVDIDTVRDSLVKLPLAIVQPKNGRHVSSTTLETGRTRQDKGQPGRSDLSRPEANSTAQSQEPGL
jgi:hypothetical protein